MSRLLREIKLNNKEAAAVLERADLRTDSDIQSLTREELHELFPQRHNFKLRRTIFDIIHRQKPVDQLLRELKDFIPHESFRAALTNNGVLVDYLRILKDMKTQMNNVQSFLDAHISFLEEFSRDQPDQDSATCGPVKLHKEQTDDRPRDAGTSDSSGQMLLHTGQTGYHPQAAQNAGTSDSRGQMLLHTGQTGGHLQAAQGYFGTFCQKLPFVGKTGVHPQIPQSTGPLLGTSTSAACGPVKLLNEQSDGRPRGESHSHDMFNESLSTRTSATCRPAESHNGQTAVRPQAGRDSVAGTGISSTSPQMMHQTGQADVRPQEPQGESFIILSQQDFVETMLVYHVVVSGKTFGAHLQLMEKVKEQVQDPVRLRESSRDHQFTFVFCPISSRIASDVEAAMVAVKDDKPVILVLMHHAREAKSTTTMRTWRDDGKVVLHVNVFYHETMRGLLKCEQNNAAVLEIWNKLLERFIPEK